METESIKRRSYLSNKSIFIGVVVLSIAILTGINNYYFYAHDARENNRNAEKIRIIVNDNSILYLCTKLNKLFAMVIPFIWFNYLLHFFKN